MRRSFLVLNDKRKMWLLRSFLIIVLGVYGVIFFSTMALGIANYNQGTRDTALYQTSLWQAGQLANPHYYLIPGKGDPTFLAGHVMPMGFVYGLIYGVFPSLYTTAMLYTIAFIVSAVFIYLSVQKILHNSFWALAFATAHLLLYTRPILDFYPIDDVAVMFISGALYFFICRRYGWATLFWVLASMHKEYYSLAVSALGGVVWIKSVIHALQARDKKWYFYDKEGGWGLLWFVGGLIWFVVAFFGIMLTLEGTWLNRSMFDQVGGIGGSVGNPINTISILFSNVLSPTGSSFIIELFIPFVFLSLLGIEYSLALLPILGILLLPDGFHSATFALAHYTYWFLPFLTIGAATGVIRLQKLLQNRSNLLRIIIWVPILGLIAFQSVSGLRTHIYWLRSRIAEYHAMTEYREDVNSALSQVPADASVAADEILLPFLSHRFIVTNLSYVDELKPKYVVRDLTESGETHINDDIYNSIYSSAFEQVMKQSPSLYYDSSKWGGISPSCNVCDSYNLIFRSGSMVIYERK